MLKKILYTLVFSLIFVILAVFLFIKNNVNLAWTSRADNNVGSVSVLKLPPGYAANLFASLDMNLHKPRQLAKGQDGWIFIGSTGGDVYALKDGNNDGVADQKRLVSDSINAPHGVAYDTVRDDLYIGAINGIYKIDDITNQLSKKTPIAPPQLFTGGFVDSNWHGTRHLGIGADNRLYVSLGTPCDVCEPPLIDFTSVIRRYSLSDDDNDGEVYAHGIRNSVGFDFHPLTQELWFTDNGRDWLGDDLPSDELNYAPRQGLHFGYPYCHQGDFLDPEFGKDKNCADYRRPALNTGAHVANLGMRFSPDGQYAYIALHGSWNSSQKVGYAIYRAAIKNNNEAADYEPFITGWLDANENVYGRPVDILFLSNNEMLISDDFANVIYRVYKNL